MQFNYSEILGNSTAVAISNAYYQDNRGAASALTKLGAQIGVDLAANVLKNSRWISTTTFSEDITAIKVPRLNSARPPRSLVSTTCQALSLSQLGARGDLAQPF
jgi:hypothetical protein